VVAVANVQLGMALTAGLITSYWPRLGVSSDMSEGSGGSHSSMVQPCQSAESAPVQVNTGMDGRTGGGGPGSHTVGRMHLLT